MLVCTQRLIAAGDVSVHCTLPLTAEERSRSRYRFEKPNCPVITIKLSRGTVLLNGDYLQAETGEIVQIMAEPEPVLTVTTNSALVLLRAAYHLGNRHIPLEITPDYLRLSPDSVLQAMLENLKLNVTAEIAPFQPELGAYHHSH
ncbi:MAG: urease accessory protein UreE [Jaaginema sp. PMC 1079.18]|nr:urease accessory protein UreE [Jaaginema sp. PMC 1080.18]MEC4851655.1 urease accessory protein UreE [Jaaginema sp. PMC 1079.18]MEC4867325.1 urease accessory protein UreE [Jaaginema sp. PMC 1078.18]